MRNSEATPFLSIVLPAYNEEKRLPPTLQRIADFLRQQPYRSEVIVVENGSIDQTSAVVEHFCSTAVQDDDNFEVRLLHSKQGKGVAVKTGMMASRGDYLIISDTDLAVPIEEVPKFIPPALDKDGFAIAIASRELAGAVRYDEPAYRHMMGRVFNTLVRILAVPGIQDTQCGFKCFTREAAQLIFPLQSIEGWGFDVELLFIAQLQNLPMVEIPVHWHYGNDSRIRPFQDTINMVTDLLRIRRNGWRGLYDRPPTPIA